MDISSLLTYIRSMPEYSKLQQAFITNEISHPLRLPRAVRPIIASALTKDLKCPIVYLLSRTDRMLTIAEELAAWDPELEILTFPDPNPLFYERAPWSPRTLRHRMINLAALTADLQPRNSQDSAPTHPLLILAPVRAAMTRTLSPQIFLENCRWLRTNKKVRYDRFIRLLIDIGYMHVNLVAEPGQFSRRGGILDMWVPSEVQPTRIEFYGEEIESLRSFNPRTQRSTANLDGILITPAREGLHYLYQEAWDDLLPNGDTSQELIRDSLLEFFLPLMNPTPNGLLDFLPKNSFVLLEDRSSFEDAVSEIEEQAIGMRVDQIQAGVPLDDFPIPYLTLVEINETLEECNAIDMGSFTAMDQDDIQLADAYTRGPRFGGQLKPLMDHLIERIIRHETVVVVSRQAPRLAELWSETDSSHHIVDTLPDSLIPGDLYFVNGALTEGWVLDIQDGKRIHLLTDAEIFGWSKPRPRPRRRRVAAPPESVYADLKVNDWVVHVDYGIGRFRGLVERSLDELRREFLLVEYDGGDQLYVPIHQADRVTRYVGVDGSPPSSSRLGTRGWERIKQSAVHAVEQVAQELLELYARRHTIKGHAFSSDTPWQGELESSFPYEETKDQLRALQEVKLDMERNRPMDRLICGDVGYGKTEVSLRAAFKAVMDGKQVAILVPTTVLAQQHFNTFRQRLSAFPVEVEMLSRFRNRQETSDILKRLSSGEIDIVIGTHRLLQRDVNFKDLALLVIDEEQRFGVTHKEHLKKMRTEVDVLTLTATPIPRTLYMALSGARDISTINTPPEERLPVFTHVGPYDPRQIRQAVLRERGRNGQVFFVHNRVQTIDAMRQRLQRLIPEASFAVAHGQMPEQELASVMESFTKGEIDVLVSTSIIESGLDIPNANTLIVDRADRFGLSQLYQLRGRVGRGTAQGYAYFFRHHRFRATEEALSRLETIAEHSHLGAGYAIAMRDLEIRGAGDILGTRQHGHISAIGFHLYTRLLTKAVRRLKATYGPETPEQFDLPHVAELLPVTIDLPLPSVIPRDYIPDRNLRLQLYRRMAEVRTLEGIEALRDELIDRFGPLPAEVENLFYQLRIRLLAAEAGVEAISTENGQILLQLPEGRSEFDIPVLGKDVRRSKRGLWLARARNTEWTSRLVEILLMLSELSI